MNKNILNIKKIIILSVPYKVSYEKELFKVDKDKRTGLLGQTDYLDKNIRIYRPKGENSNNESVFQTLLHEIIHGIIFHLNIEDHINEDMLETVVDNLATGLADTLIRNKIITL